MTRMSDGWIHAIAITPVGAAGTRRAYASCFTASTDGGAETAWGRDRCRAAVMLESADGAVELHRRVPGCLGCRAVWAAPDRVRSPARRYRAKATNATPRQTTTNWVVPLRVADSMVFPSDRQAHSQIRPAGTTSNLPPRALDLDHSSSLIPFGNSVDVLAGPVEISQSDAVAGLICGSRAWYGCD
jgi:hypothetical protein